MKLRLIYLIIVLCLGLNLEAQATIWSVDFETGYSDNDLTAQDNNTPSGADWTKSGTTSNWWRVESDQVLSGSFSMNGRNLDNTVTWTSESISISGYSNVSISINLKERNCDDGASDLIETFYNIGSGNVEFGNGNGDGDFNSATSTVTGLNGTTLTIVVTMFNDGSGERSIFDDIVVTGISSLGKDGPAGIGEVDGSGFLEFWLDANQGVSGSSPITAWSDQSGNSITNTLNGNPVLTTSSLNGYPVITFDGSGDYISTSLNISGDSYPNCDIYAVYEMTGTSSAVWGEDNGGYDRFLTDANGAGGCTGSVATGTGCSNSASLFPASTTVITSVQFAEDVSNGSSAYVNGASVLTFSSDHESETSNNFDVGSIGTGSYEMIGDIAEVFVFGQSLNSAIRNILHNYLSAKYNVSLTSNDLYDEDDSGFDHDVAGIGQESDGSHEDAQGTGIVRIHTPLGLGNGEYLIWGHDNGALDSYAVTDLPSGIESRLARQWSASETGEVGTVTISFDLSSVAGSITASDLRLLIDGDGTFASGATSTSGATHLGSNVYQWTGIDIDDNDHFTIGSIDFSQTPLPVDLVEFSATPNTQEKVVDLFWITSSEVNNDYFTVERTTDLKEFEEVTQVVGQGTTNERTEYKEVDFNPLEGVSYYRLSQTDFDGKKEYFNLEKVLFEMDQLDEIQIELYPNPNNGQTMFMKIPNTDSEELKVLVNDFIGKEFLVDFTVISHGDHSVVAIEMNEKLAAGSYLVNIKVGENVHTHKLIVQ